MSSNIKPKNPSKESPTEPFKRAVSGCLRAIAGKPELEVTFAADRPSLVICHTVKGKGLAFAEGDANWHHKSSIKKDLVAQMYDALGGE